MFFCLHICLKRNDENIGSTHKLHYQQYNCKQGIHLSCVDSLSITTAAAVVYTANTTAIVNRTIIFIMVLCFYVWWMTF